PEAQVWKQLTETDSPYGYGSTAQPGSFIRPAPTLQEAAADNSRDNTIAYWRTKELARRFILSGTEPPDSERIELTEQQALQQLDAFLDRAHTELGVYDDPELQALAQKAVDLRTGIRYIGKQEFD